MKYELYLKDSRFNTPRMAEATVLLDLVKTIIAKAHEIY